MLTTVLRIELLIIGFQASIWFVFFLGFPSHDQPFQDLVKFVQPLSDWVVPATFALLAWSYSFGATVDGITGALESCGVFLLRKFKKKNSQNDSLNDQDSNYFGSTAVIRLKFPEAHKDLIRMDFELRLLRSTAFNLIILSIAIFTSEIVESVFFAVGVICLGSLTGVAWGRRLYRLQIRRIRLRDAANRLAASEFQPDTNIK